MAKETASETTRVGNGLAAAGEIGVVFVYMIRRPRGQYAPEKVPRHPCDEEVGNGHK